MKKIMVLIAFLSLGSCEKGFFDREPLDRISPENVFSDPALAQAYLNNLIGKLPFGMHAFPSASPGYTQYPCMLASISDEARPKSGWVDNYKIIRGVLTPSNHYSLGLWNEAYVNIRQANSLITGLAESGIPEPARKQMAGAAKFVRAFMYFDLTRRYGGVPLITQVQSVSNNLLVPRTTQSLIYDFLYQELKECAGMLPDRSETPAGSISRQAAIALNARAMLYAGRWDKAAELSGELIFGPSNDGLDLYPDYKQLFLSYGGNKEVILEKLTLPPLVGHSFGLYNFPVRWRSDWGGQTCPTQEFVDAYEMADGTPFNWANPAHAADPYNNRDPRFYASVFYHGARFSEIKPSFGEPFIDMEWNNGNEGPGPKRHGAASITGYLVRKFVDPSMGFAPKPGEERTSWKEIRFAEVLLIYAEAANEQNGPSAPVYEAVNRIRLRAGMPVLPAGLTKEAMRERIRHERQIELAFENHRWFDLIRWGIAREILDGYVPHGIMIERKPGAPARTQMPQLFDPVWLMFTRFEVSGANQFFPSSHFLLPIPQDELDKNPNLSQNPGY